MKNLFLGLTLHFVMAYILHIDTSAETSLIALSKDGELICETHNAEARNHAATININVDVVLKAGSIKLKDLSAISVCGGPGSYTGLRIGLATAKGYCYALGIPLMMHSRLLLIAAKHAIKAQNIVSILQAREDEYFIAVYDAELKAINEPKHILIEDLSAYLSDFKDNAVCCGAIDEQVDDIISQLNITDAGGSNVDILAWCTYAYEEYKHNSFSDLASSEPFYLKQVYTHKPKNIK